VGVVVERQVVAVVGVGIGLLVVFRVGIKGRAGAAGWVASGGAAAAVTATAGGRVERRRRGRRGRGRGGGRGTAVATAAAANTTAASGRDLVLVACTLHDAGQVRQHNLQQP